MKPSGWIAVLLAVSLPGEAFAQNYSAATAGAAESSVSGAAGIVSITPLGLGALNAPALSAPSLALGLTPVPGLVPAANLSAPSAALALAPSAALALAVPAAAARAIPLAAAAPSALAAVPSAAAKEEKAGSATWTEKLSAMFDGDVKPAADDAAAELPPLKAFVVQHGRPMTEITLAEAAARGGQARLLLSKNDPSGLTEKDAPRVKALLASKGVNAAVSNEKLAVDWSPKPAAGAAVVASASAEGSALGRPMRELKFLAKTFAASLVKPLPSEVLGGIATKSFPLVTSIGVYWAAVGLAHPLALAGLITLSLAQEIFHGIFLKSWNNFQEVLSRERGFNYQMFFNLAYMQGFGTLYRLLSWSANPSSVTPPWSVHYWKDMAVMSVAGTFFGVMGYNGLNTLYAKGAIKRWQHSGIQQMRDMLFLLAGPFFASGSMTVFWGIFLFQQSLDLAIAIWAGRAKAAPIVFIASEPVAASAEFKAKYPAEGVAVVPPLKQAWSAVVGNPLVRLMTWPVRAMWKATRGGRK